MNTSPGVLHRPVVAVSILPEPKTPAQGLAEPRPSLFGRAGDEEVVDFQEHHIEILVLGPVPYPPARLEQAPREAPSLEETDDGPTPR
eukprot:9427295-Pyramimonas_sp.AAC.1